MAHTEVQTISGIREMMRDPSLVLALVTGSALTGFCWWRTPVVWASPNSISCRWFRSALSPVETVL